MISSVTPPGCSTSLTISLTTDLLAPPLFAFQTPSVDSSPCPTLAASADPPVAVFKKLGIPGGVSLDGGSTVLTASNLRLLFGASASSTSIASVTASAFEFDFVLGWAGASDTDTARTVSATASSSAVGSNIMFGPTEMTRSVMGGLTCALTPVVELVALFRGYRYTDASQSSSKRGSSSFSDFRDGSRVDRSAKCVVRLNSGRGYDNGGESSSIW